MIQRFRSGTVAVLVAAAMLIQCAGCSGSKEIPHPLDAYGDRSFAPAATFYFPPSQVRAAALMALRNQSCTILAVDSISHTIRAEIRSAVPIPADSLANVRAHPKPSVLGMIGSLVLFLGAVLLIVLASPFSSDSGDGDDSVADDPSGPEVAPTQYLYDISLMTNAIDDSTTDVELDVQRIANADTLLVSSAPFENIYFNFPIFDAIQRELEMPGEDSTVVK